MKLPTTPVPENGYYYHNKHSDEKGLNDCAYEVIGVGIHTEDDCRPENAQMVLYRPLYDSEIYKRGKYYWNRPLEMWMSNLTENGKTFKRFQKISNPKIIEELEKIKNEMYGEN